LLHGLFMLCMRCSRRKHAASSTAEHHLVYARGESM
jgi:hypothetical protein